MKGCCHVIKTANDLTEWIGVQGVNIEDESVSWTKPSRGKGNTFAYTELTVISFMLSH